MNNIALLIGIVGIGSVLYMNNSSVNHPSGQSKGQENGPVKIQTIDDIFDKTIKLPRPVNHIKYDNSIRRDFVHQNDINKNFNKFKIPPYIGDWNYNKHTFISPVVGYNYATM